MRTLREIQANKIKSDCHLQCLQHSLCYTIHDFILTFTTMVKGVILIAIGIFISHAVEEEEGK